MPRRKLTSEEEFGSPRSEYADLPPVLVQLKEKLHPAGVMWTEISTSSAVTNTSGRSYRGSGMGLRYRPGVRINTNTGE